MSPTARTFLTLSAPASASSGCLTLETFAPISGMYVCVNESGSHVKKEDYDRLLSRNKKLRQALGDAKKLLCEKYDFEAAAELSAADASQQSVVMELQIASSPLRVVTLPGGTSSGGAER